MEFQTFKKRKIRNHDEDLFKQNQQLKLINNDILELFGKETC